MLFFSVAIVNANWVQGQSRSTAIALRITTGAHSEQDKVAIIVKWIARHIKYDVKRYLRGSTVRYSSGKTLRRKRALCDEYSQLFKEMCEAVDVKAFVIDGYTKDLFFDVNDPFYRVDHAWNAVRIENKWFLADVTFSSGGLQFKPKVIRNFMRRIFRKPPLTHKIKFKRNFNDDYFLNTPQKFGLDHFPADPIWALNENKGIEQIETDSVYYHQRDETDSRNLHDEQGRTCAACDEKSSYTPYQMKLYMGYTTPAYNNKQEEYAIDGHSARGDSLYRVVKNHVREKSYLEEDVDSLKRVVTHYKEALYDLKCHGKNIRNEYKYKVDKERSKLEGVKKVNSDLRRTFLKERASLVNWREYSRQKARQLTKNKVKDKFKLTIPKTIPEIRPHPVFEKASEAFVAQRKAINQLEELCKRQLDALKALELDIEVADSLGLSILVSSKRLGSLRQYYYDDLKKVLVTEKKLYKATSSKQTSQFDEMQRHVFVFKRAVKSTDSLRAVIRNLLKLNYVLAANIDHVTQQEFDSLTQMVEQDFEYCTALLQRTEDAVTRLLDQTRLKTVGLISKMKKETSLLNRETGIERSRAKVVIKHYIKDRNARYKKNKKHQEGLYQKIYNSRKLGKQIDIEIRRLEAKQRQN